MKKLSRQRRWQLRQIANGCCAKCGKKRVLHTRELCKGCAKKDAARVKIYLDERKGIR